MSILKRLKDILTGKNSEKESNVEEKVRVNVKSSENEDDVSETKTSESISKMNKEKAPETKKDISLKDDGSSKSISKTTSDNEEEVESELKEVENMENSDESEKSTIESVELESAESEEIEKEAENNDSKNNKKRDNMTLLNDTELLNDSNIDKDFTAEFIDAGLETVKHCFQCGTCGGTCPSGRRTPYKVRQIVRKCLLGLKDEVISDDALWMCTTCYTCQERCPRSVAIVGIIKKARNIAAHAGYMAKAHKMTGVFVMNTGHGVPINDATKALRKQIGLAEVPPTTHSFPEALKEVQTICKACEFDELIGYDEATGGLKE